MTSTTTLPAAVYGRISQDPDNTLISVERHVRLCRERIENRTEWSAVDTPGSLIDPKDPAAGTWPAGVYVDNNISGGRADRPEYDRLMADVAAGKVRVIVAQESARLARSLPQFLRLLEVCTASKIHLHYLKGGDTDLSGVMGRTMATIMAVFDQWYRETVQESQRLVAKDHASKGAYHGRRPFGYQLVRAEKDHGEDRSLTVYEPEAELVREAYQRVAEGDGLYEICHDWDERGITSPTGQRWRDAGLTSLKLILLAARNIGMREHSPGWSGRGARPESTVLYEGHWEPIVDPGLYADVKAILEGQRQPGHSTRAAHLLSGYAKCGVCGTSLRVDLGNRGQRRYACPKLGCGKVVRREADVDAKTERVILHWLEDNGLFDQAMASAETEDVRALRAELRKLEAQRQAITDDYDDADPDGRDRAERDRRLARKDAQIDDVRGRLGQQVAGTVMADVPQRGTSFAALWEHWGTEGERGLRRRREVIAALADRVVVHPGPKQGGIPLDPRLVQVFPAGWAARLGDPQAAMPTQAPDAAELHGDGIVLAVLAASSGMWLSVVDITERCDLGRTRVRNAVHRLHEAGALDQLWCKLGTALANARTDAEREAVIMDVKTANSGTLRGVGTYAYRIREAASAA